MLKHYPFEQRKLIKQRRAARLLGSEMIMLSKPKFGEDWGEDPVFEQDGEWFFCDETWNPMGPYQTERQARKALMEYCIENLGEEVNKGDYDI